VVAIVLFALGVAVLAVMVAGIAVVANLFNWGDFHHRHQYGRESADRDRTRCGRDRFGALLLLVLDALVRLLGRYARLHYQILSPSQETL
jgi:hypothetical protein